VATFNGPLLKNNNLENQYPSSSGSRVRRWESDSSCAPPGGESIEEIQKRILSLVEEMTDEFPEGSIVLVSHVGPIKALLAAVLGIPLQAMRRLFLDPATISVVDWGTRPLLRLLNSHAHMGWPNARWMS
jgi:broad specificity phosphatase PhoE